MGIRAAGLLAAGLFMIAQPVTAQQDDGLKTPEVLESLFACKTIENPEERLACYDEGVGRVEQAQSSGDLVAIDKQAAEQIKRESFGFNIPSLPKIAFPKLGSDDSLDETVILTIERYRVSARNKYTFYMDNGQVWEQVDGEVRRKPRGSNQTLHIRPAALGSFIAQINGKGSGIRVRRRE